MCKLSGMSGNGSSSLGSNRLAEIIGDNEDSGAVRRAISHECECTEQAVRNWAAGTSAPLYRSRKLLAASRGIDIDDWDKPPFP